MLKKIVFINDLLKNKIGCSGLFPFSVAILQKWYVQMQKKNPEIPLRNQDLLEQEFMLMHA